MVSDNHVQYQKKLMIQSSENLVTDRQMDQWMNQWIGRQRGQSDFKGHCQTTIERPISECFI